ncbi:Concanavalin A-like lectin/glucanases superfamily protein [Actinokineospora terrae]|uniref:Concanavalin A-like lectin/glucanases superfamily protein n=1 Tax=Actinokineospora terrae TaxID=155974 RepID=A0A1H9XJF1_9PSEU|nr:Concanavalin A-like lectin/glucanases superfamily protein [Actinokineospora terrae]
MASLSAVIVVAVSGGPDVVVGEPVAQAPDAVAAMAAAKVQGTPVEVVGERAETRTVYAQPDGQLRAEFSVVPTRVRRGTGWVDPDPTLRPAGGVIRPVATVADVAFSTGGADKPVVRLGRGDKSVELTWPGVLPTPTVDGATATYADVLPGVDLKMTAQVDGYAQHFVVKTREAAANPALAHLRLGLKSTGVTLREVGIGGLEGVDAAGETVFASGESYMWDAKPRVETDNPGLGKALVGVEVAADSLSLVPDQAMLTAADTVFPVIIDPTLRTLDRSGWTTIYDDGTSSMRNGTHWNGYNSEPDTKPWIPNPSARVGKAYQQKLVTRSYFQFDTAFIGSAPVSLVQFTSASAYGPDCGTASHDLWVTWAQITPSTSWSSQPPLGFKVGNAAVGSQREPGCAGRKGVEWRRDVRVNEVYNGAGPTAYMMQAVSETDDLAWRKYDPTMTKLAITYNNPPNAPTGLRTDPPMTACALCGTTPYVGGTEAYLIANFSDPDGDSVSPQWHARFDGALVQYNGNPLVASGGAASYRIPFAGRHGQSVYWSAGAADSAGSVGAHAPGPQTFYIDTVAPNKAPLIDATLYPADNRWHGGAGVAGTFTFSSNGVSDTFGGTAVNDVAGYRYGWTDPADQFVAAPALGGSATVRLTPPGDGPRDLFVQSVDRAGNRSPVTVHHFYVRSGTGPLAQWSLEGNFKDTAYLGSRDARSSSVQDVTYIQGAIGLAHSIQGGLNLTAPNAVRTDESFTFATWARVDGYPKVASAVLSQSGSQQTGAALWYKPNDPAQPTLGGKWVFGAAVSDSSTELKGVEAAVPVQAKTWTHLAGVYDATAGKLRIYVNGDLAGETAVPYTPWNTTGDFLMGAMRSAGKVVAGSTRFDEVQVYDRAVGENEIKSAVVRDNVTSGHWKFDDESTANAVTTGDELIPRQGYNAGNVPKVAYEPGAVGDSLVLTGVDIAAEAYAPQVRTDSNYTVAAWVKLARLPEGDAAMTVLSQTGLTGSSGVIVGVRGMNRNGTWVPEWNVKTTEKDTQATSAYAYDSTPVKAGEWTHVAAVQDAVNRKVRLYVNGELASESSIDKPLWFADGRFEVGRAKWGTAWVDYLAGSVDEVRAYTRALGANEVRGIVAGDNVRLASYKFDGDARDELDRKHGTAVGTVDWTAGQSQQPTDSDLAVRLDGTGAVEVPNLVDATRSFSVAVWAKLDRVGGNPSVVSQDGTTASAFQVQATWDGRWAFVMHGADAAGGGPRQDRAYGPAIQVGVWTHLAAVYDADAKLVQLYVNGELAGSAAHPQTWTNPAGKFTIGRSKFNGNLTDYFPGAIDDVAVYSRSLFSDEVRAMAGRDTSLVHHYRLDEPSGAVAADSVGSFPATMTGGIGHVPGRVGNAAAFDGTDDIATTPKLALATDKSFTVSSWLKIDKPANATECAASFCMWTAVSQDDTAKSKFRLGLVIDGQNPDGRWTFEMPEYSGETEVTKASVSAASADFGTWVHLVGTYDSVSKKTRIWVNGVREGDGTVLSSWAANGGLVLGRGRFAGEPSDFWSGQIDDVRFYSGVFDKARVASLWQSYPANVADNTNGTLPTANGGAWQMNETAGTALVDTSGKNQTLTAYGDASVNGSNLVLGGVSGAAHSSVSVVETSRSFSVSAWAKADGPGSVNRTVFGQDANRTSTFSVQYRGDTGKWAIVVPSTDADNPATTVVSGAETAAVGEWQHLTLTYDAPNRQVRLYVNGLLAVARTGVSILDVDGAFAVGRAKVNGAFAAFFRGGVDDVRVFGSALTAGEVRRVHDDRAPLARGAYTFNANSGADSSGAGNDLTMTGAVYADGPKGRALVGYTGPGAVAAGPLVSTRDSFTVSAWVQLNRRDRDATAISQDGSRTSGFALGYRATGANDGAWVFGAPVTDTDAAQWAVAQSVIPATTGKWTHLTGVYDHGLGQFRIYVDGTLAGVTSGARTWAATGPLAVARGKVNGQAGNTFVGTVDEVRVDQGMVPDTEIALRAS